MLNHTIDPAERAEDIADNECRSLGLDLNDRAACFPVWSNVYRQALQELVGTEPACQFS